MDGTELVVQMKNGGRVWWSGEDATAALGGKLSPRRSVVESPVPNWISQSLSICGRMKGKGKTNTVRIKTRDTSPPSIVLLLSILRRCQ